MACMLLAPIAFLDLAPPNSSVCSKTTKHRPLLRIGGSNMDIVSSDKKYLKMNTLSTSFCATNFLPSAASFLVANDFAVIFHHLGKVFAWGCWMQGLPRAARVCLSAKRRHKVLGWLSFAGKHP